MNPTRTNNRAEAGHMMRHSDVDALPVIDEHGSALGVFALAR